MGGKQGSLWKIVLATTHKEMHYNSTIHCVGDGTIET